jgi:hypothetical protein
MVTTIIRSVITKLEQLDSYITNDLDNQLRDAEIRAFYTIRHQDTHILSPLQRYMITEWEPRISKLEESLTMPEYSKLRSFLGISDLGIKNWSILPEHSMMDTRFYQVKLFDLRDED